MKNKRITSFLAWLFLSLALFFLMRSITKIQLETELPYSEFKKLLQQDKIEEVKIRHDLTLIRGVYITKDGRKSFFKTIPLPDPDLVKELEKKGITYSGEIQRNWFSSFITNFGPVILFILLWYFLILRQLTSSGKQAISFGKSRAQLYKSKKVEVTFNDVAGCDEAKEELKEVIEFLKDPGKFRKLGAKIPKGVLLYGAPGTGKTLLAKAVAGEAGVPFFLSSGSEFVEMFVGVGAARVRDLFEQGRKHAPCVLFIDELDAVGRWRFAGIGGGHDEREQTLNQILVELDGFSSREGVILLAATNRPDVLDPALLRHGRFDRHIYVPIPDLKGREEILKVHTRNVKISDDVNLNTLARRTPGFVGADLANLVNEAALLAARKNKERVEMSDFEEAIDKILAGPEKKSRMISEREKNIIAYHESGHALVACSLPGSDPIHKVSIIPRGPSLGYTLQLPTEDKYLITKSEIYTKIIVLLAGRVAELIKFNEITTGAQNDLMKATEMAQKMICEYGMSDRLGPLTLRRKETEVFLGRDYLAHEKMYSEKTAEVIDEEVKTVIEYCQAQAMSILRNNLDKLDKLAQKLIEREILDGEEVKSILCDQSSQNQKSN